MKNGDPLHADGFSPPKGGLNKFTWNAGKPDYQALKEMPQRGLIVQKPHSQYSINATFLSAKIV